MNETSTDQRATGEEPVARTCEVVIVGAGFARLEAAKRLGRAGVDVLLLDQNNYHQFQPLLYQVATAQIALSTVARPLRSILHREQKHVTGRRY